MNLFHLNMLKNRGGRERILFYSFVDHQFLITAHCHGQTKKAFAFCEIVSSKVCH